MIKYLLLLLVYCVTFLINAQDISTNKTIYGFSIAAPQTKDLDRFLTFMEHGLVANGINTLILRVDYNYQYTSYPMLSDTNALSMADVKKLAKKAKAVGIEIIPQINLLGHQSWASETTALLREFAQFDETPLVKMPEKYVWPNDDGLYCKSYCPLHPEVHQVVFAIVDEILEAFEAKAFHAGMDEVFYIGHESCPRCHGKSKADLFANEVTLIRDHLAKTEKSLWIWGDRLLEGTMSGLGMWEGSENGTHLAIDMIPKDIVICDWHYETAEPTPVIFATKGLQVISCFWNNVAVAHAHMEMMDMLIKNSNRIMRPKYLGTMQTIWSPAKLFLDAYEGNSKDESSNAQVASFKAMINYIKKHEN